MITPKREGSEERLFCGVQVTYRKVRVKIKLNWEATSRPPLNIDYEENPRGGFL